MKTKTHLDHKSIALGYADYAGYLSSQHWTDFRFRYAQSGLPTLCVGCSNPKYHLHHLRYNNFGNERLGDVIPLCNQCHRKVHKFLQRKKLPAARTPFALQCIHGWNDKQTIDKFACFSIHWREAAEFRAEKADKKVATRTQKDVNEYYKLSRDYINVSRYIRDGYSPEDVAKMYNVTPKYVRQYIAKYPEVFS